MFQLILFLVIALPIAWLVSEFQPRRNIRIVLGIGAISMAFGVAWMVGSLERLNSNIWYGTATKDLIQNTIVELEQGNEDRVLTELQTLRSKFHPTYETRADYDKLVASYVKAVSDDSIRHDPGDPAWTQKKSTDSEPLDAETQAEQ